MIFNSKNCCCKELFIALLHKLFKKKEQIIEIVIYNKKLNIDIKKL